MRAPKGTEVLEMALRLSGLNLDRLVTPVTGDAYAHFSANQ